MSQIKQHKLPAIEAICFQELFLNDLSDLQSTLYQSYNTAVNYSINLFVLDKVSSQATYSWVLFSMLEMQEVLRAYSNVSACQVQFTPEGKSWLEDVLSMETITCTNIFTQYQKLKGHLPLPQSLVLLNDIQCAYLKDPFLDTELSLLNLTKHFNLFDTKAILGYRLLDSFSNHISFHPCNFSSLNNCIAYLESLDYLCLEVASSSSTLVVITNVSVISSRCYMPSLTISKTVLYSSNIFQLILIKACLS